MVKSGIAEVQAEGVFPCEPITHRISGLAMGRKQVSKGLIGVDRSQCITQLHQNISPWKHGASHMSGFFWNWWNWESFERHRLPPGGASNKLFIASIVMDEV